MLWEMPGKSVKTWQLSNIPAGRHLVTQTRGRSSGNNYGVHSSICEAEEKRRFFFVFKVIFPASAGYLYSLNYSRQATLPPKRALRCDDVS